MEKNHHNHIEKEKNEKDILFPDLDKTSIDFYPFLFFCGLYLFNATLLLPISIIIMIFEFIIQFFKSIFQCRFKELLKSIIFYPLDILMALSVLIMYPLAVIPTNKHYGVNFQYWAISSLIFLQSYILLQSYMYCFNDYDKKLELGFIISRENRNNLGLGRLVKKISSKQDSKQKILQDLEQELYALVEKSLDDENIDKTLFFFSLESDKGIVNMHDLQDMTNEDLKEFILRAKKNIELNKIKQELQGQKPRTIVDENEWDKHIQIIKLIRGQGFRGNRHIIHNLLWPHYQYVKLMQKFSSIKLFIIIFFVLVVKIAFPIWAILYKSKKHVELIPQFLILGVFIGMYLNMLSILNGLLINDDLKGRKYILNVLETLIIQTGEPQQEQQQDQDESFESSDLPYNKKYKLDLSCNLSLESWDNARRLVIVFDQKKQDEYETTFSFLAIYLFYTYIILSQDFLGFDLFPSLHKFFKSPIQEYNMLCDFVLVSMLFLTRINQGSLYNETFKKLQDTIKKTSSVYEDKKSLFDFYFSSNIIYKIKNETYKNITHRIYCTAAEKVLYALAQQEIYEFNTNVYDQKFKTLVAEQSKQRVLQLCATMEKLVSQIEFDSEHFCHKFLGWFKSNIAKTFSTFFILMYIFFHSKIKHYLKKHKKKGK